jgi:hypothetical protein
MNGYPQDRIYVGAKLHEIVRAGVRRWYIAVDGQCLDARQMYRTRKLAREVLRTLCPEPAEDLEQWARRNGVQY